MIIGKIVRNNINDPVDFEYVEVNTAIEKHTGFPKEEYVGKCYSDFVNTSLLKRHLSIIDDVVTNKTSSIFKEYFHDYSRELEVNVFYLDVDTFGMNLRDISESKAVEQSLRSHIEHMDRINTIILHARDMDSMLDCVLTEMLDIFSVERAWLMYPNDLETNDWAFKKEAYKEGYVGASVTGLTPEMRAQATGMYMQIRDTLDVHIFDYVRDYNQMEITDPFSLKNQMLVVVPISKEFPWVFGIHQCAKYKEWTKADIDLMREISRRLHNAIVKHTHYNDLKVAKEHAEESDRLKTAFLANMSHEIRTPMNGILGFAELLKAQNLSPLEHNEYLELIELSGNRMLNLINNLVDISKIESGQVDVHYTNINIKELLNYISHFFAPEVEKKGLLLQVYSVLSCEIVTDYEKLYAILTNLVKNAIKFTEQDGSITVTCEKTEKGVQFKVIDTGIGIDLKDQHVIFDRFIQAGLTDMRVAQGAGLGLSITKAFVEILGGSITVESEVEKGTTFTVILPCKCVDQAGSNI